MTREALSGAVSPALLEAQRRLLAMRAERGFVPLGRGGQRGPNDGALGELESSPTRQTIDPALLRSLPEHLGWGSERLGTHLRRALARTGRSEEIERETDEAHSKEPDALFSPCPATGGTPGTGPTPAPAIEQVENAVVRLYPTIALGMLRAKLAAAGRVWLLLRWLDTHGQGWVPIHDARQALCDTTAAFHLCTWRQLRNLLSRGESVFWEQRAGRIWLRSVPKVALALGVSRLSGHPVDLPLAVLFAGMGAVRAHLYASFHSGRRGQNPISRAALAHISDVSPRSQQSYEARAEVRKRRNYAIGPELGGARAEELAWGNGAACFVWHDRLQVLSDKQRAHLAWQLPNSYEGPHKQRPNGRQRQFNRQLAVLSNKGMTGNGQKAEDMPQKRYFRNASKAVRFVAERNDMVYWPDRSPGRWYCLPALASEEAV